MKRIFIYLLLLLLPVTLDAQKVGLVLSGGGAKGLTHIGIIHALEDNNIPIDYIAGTSIGAIVGSLYAMGYTPQEMMDLISSPDFQKCYSGVVDEGNIYYIKKNDPTPEFFNVKVAVGDSINIVQALPVSLINPIYMNIKILELFAQATASSGGNFNQLFVPFRCVASNVYDKEELVFNSGDLGTAVRASMTFPFVFKPININGILAYDGGIYNNFPADIMQRDFHPDFTIGSVVAKNNQRPNENDIFAQINSMIMDKTNYSLPDSSGILMTFDLQDEVNLLDFNKVQLLHDLGYRTTMEFMDSIKQKISRRVPLDSLNRRRELYKQQLPKFRFQHIHIQGANENQKRYIEEEIKTTGTEYFTLDDFKEGYFRLLSDNSISEIRPTAIYNPQANSFDLNLKVTMEENLSLLLGGALSTSNINQIYYGLYYNHLSNYSTEVLLDGQLGRIYNNVELMARYNFATEIPMSFRVIGGYSTIDYYKNDYLFSSNSSPAFNIEHEAFFKVKAALPFMSLHKAEFGIGYGKLTDKYIQSSTIDLNNLSYNTNIYKLFGGSIFFGRNSLNSIQYATKGTSQYMLAQIYTGREAFYPQKKSNEAETDETISWMQLSFKDETYFDLTRHITVGSYVEAYYSSRNFSQNYTATMMQAGSFTPTPSSTFTYNNQFRANQFFGLGVIPIYQFSSIFQLRTEFYAFVPIYPILKNEQGKAYYGKAFSNIGHTEQISLVGKFSTVVASAYLSHDSSQGNSISLGITLGWHLFNHRFIER